MTKYKILFIIFFNFTFCKSDPIIEYINHYQQEETQMNGHRCPLYPTCSQYAKELYINNSFLGFFLTLERMLIRERGDLSSKFLPVPDKLSPERQRYYDPIENSSKKASLLKEDF
jgi:putative component of membrane protein insertase Oxa1/YidC/SpoIIIJ protein YidD